MSNYRVTPWLLWGARQTYSLTPSMGNPNLLGQVKNLSHIEYGRPESWRFILGGNVINATGQASMVASATFQVSIGLGSTALKIPYARKMAWKLDTFAPGAINTPRYSTTLFSFPLNDLFPNDVEPLIDVIVADTIDVQCSVSVYVPGTTLAGPIDMELISMFAPVHHARPEWHYGQFSGEDKGR